MPILRQRLRLVYFLLVCGLFSLLLLLLIMSSNQYATNQDAINRIDHTGRLRMLGQRTVQRIILATTKVDTRGHEVSLSRRRFETTLAGLRHGSSDLRLRPASDEKTIELLKVIEQRWGDILQIETTRIIYGADSVDTPKLAMLGDQLLEECERLMIAERQRLAEGHIDTAQIVAGSLFCILLLGAISLRLVGHERRLYAAEESARTSHELLTSVQKSEARLKAIFASSIDPLFTMDRDLKIENASDSVEATFGLSNSEVVGKNLRELVTQIESQTDEQSDSTAGQDLMQLLGKPLERTALRSDGSEFPCLLTVWAVDAPDDSDSPLFICIVRDITEQKRAEAEIDRNATFLQNIINAVPDLLSVKADDLRLVIANEAYCEAMGVPKEQLLGKNEKELETRVVMEDTSEIAQRVLATGQTEVVEQVATLADGTQHLYAIKKSRYEDPVTAEKYVVSTARDITEIKKRQQKLLLLANVFNNSTEGAAILDCEGSIVEANPTFSKIANVSINELQGRSLQRVLDWDLDRFPEVLEMVAEGERWVGTTRVIDELKEEHAYLVSFSSMQVEEDGAVNIVALFNDVTEIHRAQKRLRRQAMLDNVTNLPNRRFFRQQIEQMIEDAPRDGTRFAVCFIDLDDFKHVNDSLGHQAGDELLRMVAHRIEEHVPSGTLVTRFGGDEFALLVSDVDPECIELTQAMDEFLLAHRQAYTLDETEVYVGASVGITLFPDHGESAEDLLMNADLAMYAAKEAGKNQWRIYSDEMRTKSRDHNRIHSELRRALEGNELRLAYQPQIEILTGKCIGCEALARWRLPDGREVSPGEFIPVAEATGLIVPLSEEVLYQACRQLQTWREEGYAPPRVAVNISPKHLRHESFLRRVREILKETKTPPELLEFEITENAVMDDVHHAVEIVEQLRAMNIAVAIDDFGTGYSSLSYLKNFDVQTLKIDQTFIKDIPEDRNSVAIVRSVVSLGKGRGLTVVAEGVEKQSQYEILCDLDCDVIQGFLVSRPLSPSKCTEWFESLVANAPPLDTQFLDANITNPTWSI